MMNRRESADSPYVFRVPDLVRDYECDMHGIVNNAVYLNYLEHARRLFLLEHGVGFAALAERGVTLRLTDISIGYRHSLRSGDRYTTSLSLSKTSGVLIFEGNIHIGPDAILCARSTAKIAVLQDGQLTAGEFFDPLLASLR